MRGRKRVRAFRKKVPYAGGVLKSGKRGRGDKRQTTFSKGKGTWEAPLSGGKRGNRGSKKAEKTG